MSLLELYKALRGQASETEASSDQSEWPKLIERIQAWDPHAIADFRRIYSPGIRFLLERYTGTEGMEQRLEQVLGLAMEGIRKGRIRRPADIPALIRMMAKGGFAAQEKGGGEAANNSAFIEGKARMMAQRLRNYDRREQEMLIRYYLKGQSTKRILQEMQATEEEFLALKTRVRQEAWFARMRKPVAEERGLTGWRTAAASGE